MPGIREVLADLSSNLDALEAGIAPTWEGLAEPLERMTDRLSRAWGVVSHLKVRPLSPHCLRLPVTQDQIQSASHCHPRKQACVQLFRNCAGVLTDQTDCRQ